MSDSDQHRIPVPIPAERTDVLPVFDPARPARTERDRYALTLLTGVEAGLVHELDAAETVLGRGPDCQLRIDDSALSRRHCRVFRGEDGHYVEDLGSTNGTRVDGQALSAPRRLDDGARIQMGRDTVLKFSKVDALEAEASRRLYESAMNDPLTGVHNRRYLDEHLRSEFAFAARHGSALSLLIVDADHFKRVNDTWGHPAGDAVLRALAVQLQRSVRAEDLVARFGGEEFAVLTRGITGEGAVVLAERIRRSVEGAPVLFEGQRISLTVSVGVVTMERNRGFASPEALLEAADGALYRAKQGGRNRAERG